MKDISKMTIAELKAETEVLRKRNEAMRKANQELKSLIETLDKKWK